MGILTALIKVAAVLALVALVPLLRRRVPGRKIQPEVSDVGVRRHEAVYAVSSVAVTAAVGLGASLLVGGGQVALRTAWPPAGRLLVEVAAFVLLFDLYFYALHRLLHTDWLYRRVHAVHHRSTSPTALTALCFHPAEAAALVLFFPTATWLLSLHLPSVAVATVFLSGSIALAHCGYELFPGWWHRVPVLDWYVTPLVHDTHHTDERCNYGATLSLFDRVFGTFALRPEAFYERMEASSSEGR